MPRKAIIEFSLANPIYSGAQVDFWTVSGGAKTTTHATLYTAPTGSDQHENPMLLDSEGKSQGAIYIDEPVVATISGITVPDHDTGIISSMPEFRVDQATAKLQYSFDSGASWNDTGDYVFRHRGDWLTTTAYARNDTAVYSNVMYLCVAAHTSGTFATDLAANKWKYFVDLSANLAAKLDKAGDIMTGDLIMGAGTKIKFEGATDNDFETDVVVADPTDDRTITLPDASLTVAGIDIAQNFTAPQRSAYLSDNDGSFDLGAKQNFKCTPTGAVTLTFANQSDGISGSVIFVNGSSYAVSAHANTKISTSDLTILSATGTYRIDYTSDGTNAYCSVIGPY